MKKLYFLTALSIVFFLSFPALSITTNSESVHTLNIQAGAYQYLELGYLDEGTTYTYQYTVLSGDSIDVFFTDRDGLEDFQSGDPCFRYDFHQNVTSVNDLATIPTQDYWYVVIIPHNKEASVVAASIELTSESDEPLSLPCLSNLLLIPPLGALILLSIVKYKYPIVY